MEKGITHATTYSSPEVKVSRGGVLAEEVGALEPISSPQHPEHREVAQAQALALFLFAASVAVLGMIDLIAT